MENEQVSQKLTVAQTMDISGDHDELTDKTMQVIELEYDRL